MGPGPSDSLLGYLGSTAQTLFIGSRHLPRFSGPAKRNVRDCPPMYVTSAGIVLLGSRQVDLSALVPSSLVSIDAGALH